MTSFNQIEGVPRLKLHNAITLEDPARATIDFVHKEGRRATDLSEDQLKTIALLKKQMNIEDPSKKVRTVPCGNFQRIANN